MKQETKPNRKNLRWYMRYLHNKIGFFIVGLLVIYSLSGVVQTYRDTDWLKQEIQHEKQLAPALSEAALGAELKLRNFRVTKSEGGKMYFQEGSYDQGSGLASYTTKELYSWITPFVDLHKTPSKSLRHYFTLVFGILMFFMAISSFWMFKPGTKLFSSGVYLAVTGAVAAILLMLM
ncbi:hypothetical protein ACFSQD_11085 [Flavihumibacter stibioxidans]|uniref:PepSY-associated TM region n=1 Tax=Flavihumibacter stibioxidans TaxID=1834163 RepID=A0ABR7M9W4_9BACT|nr:hypothetical protein [Flavihumibacter stibioxidans]MBC6491833.1 hypothetical protein [Flavihumibacter stibioxidans]